MEVEPGTVHQDPTTKRVAIKTDLPTPGKEWFVFDLVNGGHYTNGVREEVYEWQPLHS